MITGQLHLYGMKGLFFKSLLHISSDNFETKQAQLFDGGELFDTPENDLESRYYFTPVDVDAITEYVTGSFTDGDTQSDNYKVTIWLLVEECPIPINDTKSEVTNTVNHG